MKTNFWSKEVDHLGHEFELLIIRQIVDPIDRRFDPHAAVARFENDSLVVKGFDAGARAQRQGEIDGRCAGVKKVERPDINGAAGEVGASWCRRFDDHSFRA